MKMSRSARIALTLYGVLAILFLYLPIISVGFASVSKARYLTFPIKRYATKWYGKAIESSTVQDLLWTSLSVALLVTVISMVVGFFGALAFARYQWRFRGVFQKLILLPIFFPQAVLGLALLLWFNALGIIPTWKTAVVAHLVWISPIATLIIAIRAYSFDPSLEEAARDLGKLSSVAFYHGSRFNAAGVALRKNGFRLFPAGPVSGHTLDCDIHRITSLGGDRDAVNTDPQ